jgi:alkyl hydroperoxide reductase subunit AhpC
MRQDKRNTRTKSKPTLTVLASWIAFPSAMGSLKGIPNSMTSDPPRSIANMAGTVEAAEGYPAVRKVTKALLEVDY